jgi:pimeloyl-ACP methyl ester carboxylesterase
MTKDRRVGARRERPAFRVGASTTRLRLDASYDREPAVVFLAYVSRTMTRGARKEPNGRACRCNEHFVAMSVVQQYSTAQVSCPVIECVSTVDGARISVKRRPVPGGVPVVMLHGLGANADQWDLPEVQTPEFHYYSIASRLQESGLDLWMLNFRGCGWPTMFSEPPPHERDWNVDHYITFDLPAVLEHVARVTGQRPLVMAQSMGAMVLGAHLVGAVREGGDTLGSARIVLSEDVAVERQLALRGCVFIEMPAALRWPASIYQDGRLEWRRLLREWMRNDTETNYPFEILSRFHWLEAPLTAAGRIPLERLRPMPWRRDWWQRLPGKWQERGRRLQMRAMQGLLDLSSAVTGSINHRAEVLHHGRRMIMDRLQAGVLRQFAKGVRARAFVSDTGLPDVVYSNHYERIVLPALCIAGGRDRIANATVMKEAFFDRIRSADKQFLPFESLSHGEFGVAPITCELLYPRILDWLRAHAG